MHMRMDRNDLRILLPNICLKRFLPTWKHFSFSLLRSAATLTFYYIRRASLRKLNSAVFSFAAPNTERQNRRWKRRKRATVTLK